MTAEEVYAQVLISRVFTVAVLVICVTVSPVILWSLWKMRRVYLRVEGLLNRVEGLLELIERHAKQTDNKEQRTVLAVEQVREVTTASAKAAAVKAETAAIKVEETKSALHGYQQILDRKLEGLAQVTRTVHRLLNGRMGTQLKLAAILSRRLAEMTKLPEDLHAAEMAERLSREHDEEGNREAALLTEAQQRNSTEVDDLRSEIAAVPEKTAELTADRVVDKVAEMHEGRGRE